MTRARRQRLKEIFARYQKLDCKITLAANEKLKATYAYFIQNYFLTCEDYYHEAADYMTEVLDGHKVRELRPATYNVSGLNNSVIVASLTCRPSTGVDFDKWESFRDKFKSMIHDDQILTNVERHALFVFICKRQDASNALDHLAMTNDNFTIAWNILASRYDNKRRLIMIHLQSLFNLSSLSTETSNDLRDQTNKAIQALSNLGCEHWDD